MSAFRCKTCGYICQAEHAGENDVPHACQVCGGGITHSPTVEKLAAELARPDISTERRIAIAAELSIAARGQEVKTWQPDNWEILAEATPERLKELGVKAAVKHSPKVRTVPTFDRTVKVQATDGIGTKDK